MYVYKLNEDKILFCINIHLRTVRAVATLCWLICSTNLVIVTSVCKKDLKNHVDSYHHPSHFIESSDQKSSYRIISFISFLFSRDWVVVPEWSFASWLSCASDDYNVP